MKSDKISIGSKRVLGALVCVACFGFAFAPEASAQRRSNWQYQPSKQALSPYLNLLQTNFGPVPNYYSLVRPRLAQDSFNRQVEQSERAQSLRIQAISEQETQTQPISRTGKSSGFMDYLHYYPAPGARTTVGSRR